MGKKKLAIVLGIRPDVIRASLVLNAIRSYPDFEVCFIWSGQHYSDNLKDIFFRELGVKPPDVELNANGETDAEISSAVIGRLYPVLDQIKPEAVVFLGDTNTVMGCLAAAQLNIPIVHIEGCMRSYDWRMPEEKYRTVIDHLSDVIYAYFVEYKEQGVAEGLNPENIIVVGNPIVDVLNKHYYEKKSYYDALGKESFFSDRGIRRSEYYLMTCHRRENVHDIHSLQNILSLSGGTDRRIYFPASYRTQKVLKENGLHVPANVFMVDPIGYQEMLVLMTNSRGVITDSGTVVEETCVLQVPSLQIRKATERPQVYDVGSCVKVDPTRPEDYPHDVVFRKLESLYGKTWPNPLGDGKASERITEDLLWRLREEKFSRHKPSDYHLDITRSFREDAL
ncbi:MAG: UDP-N-acetylglucosamine 2-epimerase (non-hydrolyzing) [Nitrososphaerales archaeon]